jgi:hypothetical protein
LAAWGAQEDDTAWDAITSHRHAVAGRKDGFLMLADSACIAYTYCMQYTIRNIPEYLDAALRCAAREQGKSLNEVAVETMVRGAGLGDQRSKRRDLSFMTENWEEEPAFDEAIAAQDTVDEEMWR